VKILFVLDRRVNAGSIQAIDGYLRAGDELGHTIAVLGPADQRFPGLRASTHVESFDQVVFIFESTLNWLSGLKLSHLLSRVPRERRVILDADGMLNDVIWVDGYDRNHPNEASRLRWRASYEALSDRVFQPTLRPLSSQVTPLLFYGYNASIKVPYGWQKSWDILHIGHNWWRWRQIGGTLMPAFERLRPSLRGICFVGWWWDKEPAWASGIGLAEAFRGDPDWMRRLGVQIEPPVQYADVVATMSAARINIMTQRPLFQRLGFVTSKYFEIFCADTIPLVMLPPDQVEEVYGPAGREIALYDDVEAKLLDVLNNTQRYRDVVVEVRRHLEVHHSYHRRLQELVNALEWERSPAERVFAP
jgi:hypothetical protein